MFSNLFEAILSARHAKPGSVAFSVPNGRELTYEEAYEAGLGYAAALKARGLSKGDRVVVKTEKSIETFCLYLGCLAAGIVFIPANTMATDREVLQSLQDAEARAFISAARWADIDLSETTTEPIVLSFDGVESDALYRDAVLLAGIAVESPPTLDDPAVMLYTSGTTGVPKGALIKNRNLVANAQALVDVWGMLPSDTVLHCLPIFHGHGLFLAGHVPLMAGARILLTDKFDPEAALDLFEQSTVFMGVPTLYNRLVQSDRLDARVCSKMRLFISGSAPLSPEVFEAFAMRTGHTILERYGTTETSICCSNPLDGDRRPGTVGKPIPTADVRILDADGNACPPGVIGEIVIGGPSVFDGYWRKNRSEEHFTEDGYFRPGDLGSWSEDGYLSIAGRVKDMVITGGYNVYAREVETELEKMDGVLEAIVFGVPHADFGEGVVAIVVPEAGKTLPSEPAVILHAKAHLSSYKVPKRILADTEIPRSPVGKVMKHALRDRYADLFGNDAELTA